MTRRSVSPLIGGILLASTLAFGGVRLAAQATGAITGNVDVAGIPNDANVVIYIEKAPGTFPPQAAEMDQHDMEFRPHILPVVVGSTVTFLNHDPVPHNVFSPDYEKYDLGTWKMGLTRSYTFKTCRVFPCAYTQLCRLHQDMSAHIVVLQNPYFAVSDTSGNYTIKDVPAGSYTLAVWYANRLTAAPKSLTVAAGKTLTEDFALKP